MKQYKSLDLAKFVSAILIIILHTAPFATYSNVLNFGFRNIITVIAVPFFFLTSGFLAFKKIDSLEKGKRNAYVFQYLKRITVMYLIWTAVYFVFVVIKWTRGDFSIFSVLEYIKDFFFEGSYSTIWFLPALFGAILIVYLLHKRISYTSIFTIFCFVYLFTLGGSSYYGLVTDVPFIKAVYDAYYSFFDSIKNAVCFGGIFVSMGAMVAEREEAITKSTTAKKAIVPVIICAILLAVEEFLVAYFGWNDKGVDTVIMLVPFTYFFVRFLLCWNVNISDSTCVAMRKYSILMFLTQRIPLSIMTMFFAETIIVQNSMLYFAFILFSTILISFLILKASKKISWLRFAY
ncbi:MAG: acyltransferase [Clostridia bacterium]|nr:acyltransferase [Clostridia bacterium]